MSITIDYKIRVVRIFRKHGMLAAQAAVELEGRKISLSTLYKWNSDYRVIEERGKSEWSFAPRSKRPKTVRQSSIPEQTIQFIKQCRIDHFGIGKEKIYILLTRYCINNNSPELMVSISSIGRVIQKLLQSAQIPQDRSNIEVTLNGKTGKLQYKQIKAKLRKKKNRKPKDYQVQKFGDIVQVDAITYQIGNLKRYFICMIDLWTRIAHVKVFDNLNSSNARIALEEFERVYSIDIKNVQTDNGLEYHKYFDQYLLERGISHFWNHPRTPKQNAFIERFNRTIEDELIDINLLALKQKDCVLFNQRLADYLHYYNYIRPHWGLQLHTPISVLENLS